MFESKMEPERQVSARMGVRLIETATDEMASRAHVSIAAMIGKTMNGRLRSITAAAFLLVLCVGFSSSSRAAFVLTLNDPATVGVDETIVDNGAGDDDLTEGIINFNAGLANSAWSINITIALSKPVLINPEANNVIKLDLLSVNVQNTGAATLEITLTDTDYTLPVTDRWNVRHRLGGTTNGTVTADVFIDLANMEFGMGSTPGTLYYGAGAFSGTAHLQMNNLVTPNPFSVTQRITIVHTASYQLTSFDSELVVYAPEPDTLGLFGLGLTALGFARRKRAA